MNIATLIDSLHLATKQQPDQIAFRFLNFNKKPNDELTYIQLWQQTENIASNLQGLIKPGERVLILFEPGLSIIPSILACFYIGAIAIPAYPPRPQQLKQGLNRLQSLIDNADPSYILCSNLVAKILKAENTAAILHNLLRFNARNKIARLKFSQYPLLIADSFVKHKKSGLKLHSGQPIAFLQYSSGSTGNPKGVITTHKNLLSACRLMQAVFRSSRNSHMVSWLPITHNLGLVASILQTLYSHSSATLFSPLDFVANPTRWLESIHKYQGNASGGPQFAYDYCTNKINANEIDHLNLSCWKYAGVGGERVIAERLEKFANKFTIAQFNQKSFIIGYGLSETTVGLCSEFNTNGLQTKSFQSADHEISTVVSCGEPLPEHEAIVVDPVTKLAVSDGKVGEVWCKGPCISEGYWRNQAATEETFKAYTQQGQGPYMRTGDLGFKDNQSLYIVGRLKELIIIHGKNFIPNDIEKTIEKLHPKIRSSGCIAFSYIDDGVEMLGIACELIKEKINKPILIKSITESVRHEFGIYVNSLILLKAGELPRTANNKLQRLQCKKNFLNKEYKVDYRKVFEN